METSTFPVHGLPPAATAGNAYLLWYLPIGTCSVLVLAAAAFMAAYIRIKRRAGQPPGPAGLPFIGHLHLLGSLPHQTLAHLSQRYGPLMSLRLGSFPLLVASSSDMAKLVLHTHDKVFCHRPQNLSVPAIAFNSLDIAYCSVGPYWKLMRQLCFTEFFSPKRLDYFRSMREEEVRRLMRSLFAEKGKPIFIREKLHATNSNLITRMILGRCLQELEAASKCLPSMMELFRMMGMVNVSDFMPWLAWMDLQGFHRRSRKAAQVVKSMFQEVIDQRRAVRSLDDPPHDFLDVLLIASLASPLHIGDEHISAVMMDMLVGGTDTGAITIEWALAELLANPKKLAILRVEIDDVVGCSRLVVESDLPNLPYLRAVVNETLRLHTIVPLLLPRVSMEPCQLSNYHIPKNTLLYINAWAIHKDPSIWDNPLEFCPERFLNVNIDALMQHCKFFPFGGDRRICPAWKLGLLNVQSILGNLIHAFDWKTSLKSHMRERPGLVITLEEPLIVVSMPKLLDSLFESSMESSNE